MACQSKTFINDLGSDVVAEITNQLNTATGYLVGFSGSEALAASATDNFVLAYFEEDVMIEDVIVTFDNTGSNADKDTTAFSLIAGVGVDGTGAGTSSVVASDFTTVALAKNQFASFKNDIMVAANTVTGALPMSISARSSFGLRIFLKAGDGMNTTKVLKVVVNYRPVKDKLTLSPAIPAKAFSSTNR